MDCPAHQWYFEEMRKPPKVCDNTLMTVLQKEKEKLHRIPNRKMRRKKKKR
jgi:hypothetical protein